MSELTGKNGASHPARDEVLAAEADFLRYNAPQLPDSEASIVQERLREAERLLASPDASRVGYNNGAAKTADEVLVVLGKLGKALLTSEHATVHWRQRRFGSGRYWLDADYGTAALGQVVGEDTASSFITLLGKQTGDANDDPEHAFKAVMRHVMAEMSPSAHLGLHGMAHGRVASLADARGYNVILGIGATPSDETLDAVNKIQAVARTYDLRLGVNQAILRFVPGSATPRQNADGSIETINFAAKGAGTTRAFAQRAAAEQGMPLAALQVEFSQVHRLMPIGHEVVTDEKRRTLGIYLGYLFLRDCAELLAAAS